MTVPLILKRVANLDNRTSRLTVSKAAADKSRKPKMTDCFLSKGSKMSFSVISVDMIERSRGLKFGGPSGLVEG